MLGAHFHTWSHPSVGSQWWLPLRALMWAVLCGWMMKLVMAWAPDVPTTLWPSTGYLNGWAFPASTVRECWNKHGLKIAENISVYTDIFLRSRTLKPNDSRALLNWSSPLTSGTIGTVGFAASLGPCQPRLTADLDLEWETIPFQGYRRLIFSTQILVHPVAVWRLPQCFVRSPRTYSTEPKPSYRPTLWEGLEIGSVHECRQAGTWVPRIRSILEVNAGIEDG